MWKIQFSNKVSNIVRGARFDSMVRNFFEMFLRARRALEFSHSQDPNRALADWRQATGAVRLGRDGPEAYILRSPRRRIMKLALIAIGLFATTSVVYAACVFC